MMEGLSKTILSLIRTTRPMLLPHWGTAETLRHKTEAAVSVVTQLDEDIEHYLAESLKKIDPTIEFAGEEFGGNRTAERFWLADPIDGTAHFIRGLPFCTTMLSLIEEGQVVFSVIYDFINDIAYHAEKGKGAYQNGQPIHVSERTISDSYIAWETHMDKPKNMETVLRLREQCMLFKTISAGYEFIQVATGRLEARICFDPYGGDYDYAPGTLLVAEAGGIVANLGKTSYDYRNLNFIAANPHVFRALTEGPAAIFPIL
jgi:histidinol-phosphatase